MSEQQPEFTVTSLYPDENGDSHFEDLQIPLISAGDIGYLSEKVEARSIQFRYVSPGYDFDFHNAPKRQFIFLLDGVIQIETSLGETRKFSGGDVLLVEDTIGKGHRTKNITPVKRKSIFVEIPENLDLKPILSEKSERV